MKFILLMILAITIGNPCYAKKDEKQNQIHLKAHRKMMDKKRNKMNEHREKLKSNTTENLEIKDKPKDLESQQ